MTQTEPQSDLRQYLRDAREALRWKLDGLSEYDIRRPLTPTGTNLLGLVKHAATAELLWLGYTFGRPSEEPLTWLAEGAGPNASMWATLDETREDIIRMYRQACMHSDATIDTLPLDAVGDVPMWPGDRGKVTLHRALVHMIAETSRHAGHADVVRELIDGAVGKHPGEDDMTSADQDWWRTYRERLEQVAREAGQR
jgi:uncharacterized damage-inducible protein DinB